MRIYSNQQSTRTGEASALAILETIAAMLTAVLIAVYLDTWWHIIIGFLVSPLLLLRTDASCERALRWFKSLTDFHYRMDQRGGASSAISTIVLFVFLPAIGLVIRTASTFVEIGRHPKQSILAIPHNWWRVTMATDFATSPEYLPHPVSPSPEFAEIAEDVDVKELSTTFGLWKTMVDLIKSEGSTPSAIVTIVFGAIIIVPLFVLPMTIVAVSYRWSLKSTAIGWLPLMWALKPIKKDQQSWQSTLAKEFQLRRPQVAALWSAFCIVLLGAKYVLWAIRYELAESVAGWVRLFDRWRAAGGLRRNIADSPLAEAIVNFVRPGAVPLWQVAALINSVLAIAMWLQMRKWLADYQHGPAPANGAVSTTLRIMFFFRRLLTTYIIVCNGYIFAHIARKLPIPTIGPALVPWL